jgi:SulP family sulfate permease
VTAGATLASLLPGRADLAAVRRAPLRDLLAGTTVALVALPLALAFGVTSGLGARAGLVTAIVAGAVAAVFGGSNLQVSGPTGAMTVVLVPVYHRFGADGVLTVGVLAGAILVALAVARLGRFVRYLPISVVEGFTAGIAVVIALQQLPAALGVPGGSGERVWAVAFEAARRFVLDPAPASVLVSLGVAAAILVAGRRRPGFPFSLVAVAGATLLAHAASLPVRSIGALPSPLAAPSVGFLDPHAVRALLPSALAVAALGALESLLSATVADGMTVNQRHDPDRELFGQGLANLAVPFFGGVPATGAIARTAVNVRAGAGSRLAALVHAVVLALVVLAAAPFVSLIPVAALAGVLLATSVRMVEVASLLALARTTRGDAAVLALTFAVTVAVDLVTAVAIGIGAAVLLAVRSIARSARLDEVPLDAGDHSEEERALFADHIVAYRFDGPLFFAAAHQFLLELTQVTDARVVILRMSRVSTIDATGGRVLADAVEQLERRGITVLLSGVARGHDEVLRALGAVDRARVFADTPAAIEAARLLVRLEPTVAAA